MLGRRQVGRSRAFTLTLEALVVEEARDAGDARKLHRLQRQVGQHAEALDALIAGHQILGDGELQRELATVRARGLDHLDAALAEARAANDDRPPQRLQTAADDLGGACRLLVDHHHHRYVGRQRGRVVGGVDLAPDCAAHDDELAPRDEKIDHLGRLGEQASGVPPQIQDHARLALAVAERLVDLVGGVLLEVGDPKVADVAGQGLGNDTVDLDRVALDLEVERLVAATDLDHDDGAHLAAQPLLGLGRGHVDRGLVVDLQQHVAATNTGQLGGHARQDLDDEDAAVLLANLGSDAAEATAGAHAKVGVLLGRQQDGVRIERGEQAVDRRVLQLVKRLGLQVQHVLREHEDLLEATRRGRQPAQLAERELGGPGANRDLQGLARIGDFGEELRGVQSEQGRCRQELLPGIEAAGIEVVGLDDPRRPDQKRKRAVFEAVERIALAARAGSVVALVFRTGFGSIAGMIVAGWRVAAATPNQK